MSTEKVTAEIAAPTRRLGKRRRRSQVDVNGLKRLSRSYSWQLLSKFLDVYSNELTSSFVSEARRIVRSRCARSYYELESQWGLQSISRWRGPTPGNPAVVHQFCSLHRKNSDLPLYSAKERREACLTRVRQIDDSLPSLREEWLVHPVYTVAAEWIRAVLGPVPDAEAIALSAKHGPGSTASLPYSKRSTYFKYADFPYWSTPPAHGLLTYCIESDARWASSLEDAYRQKFDIPPWALLNRDVLRRNLTRAECPYNVITTVPKDGRKDRPIAKEQLGNIYLQLGVGNLIRVRLRAAGLDLDRQAEVNRAYALEASATKSHYTIDLSNASDTISRDLVEALLPEDWFRLLCDLRAPWGMLPNGDCFLYKKFSSMGNGYTFELETLIFRALLEGISYAHGCPNTDDFAVFGDDIIGPDYLYQTTCNYLEYSGFQVNSEKSFHGDHQVRESCGVDALNGLNIRPVFCKQVPRSCKEAMGLRNRLRAWSIEHLGVFPLEFDEFLLSSFAALPPIGPDSDEEWDSWLHDGVWSEGRTFQALVGRTAEIPARDFRFRKLMHSLRSCSGDGGNFVVSEECSRVRLVDRVVIGGD